MVVEVNVAVCVGDAVDVLVGVSVGVDVGVSVGVAVGDVKQEMIKKLICPEIFKYDKVNERTGEVREAYKSFATITKEETTYVIDKFRDYSAKKAGIYLRFLLFPLSSSLFFSLSHLPFSSPLLPARSFLLSFSFHLFVVF